MTTQIIKGSTTYPEEVTILKKYTAARKAYADKHGYGHILYPNADLQNEDKKADIVVNLDGAGNVVAGARVIKTGSLDGLPLGTQSFNNNDKLKAAAKNFSATGFAELGGDFGDLGVLQESLKALFDKDVGPKDVVVIGALDQTTGQYSKLASALGFSQIYQLSNNRYSNPSIGASVIVQAKDGSLPIKSAMQNAGITGILEGKSKPGTFVTASAASASFDPKLLQAV